MIARRYNTYELYKKIAPDYSTVNGKYLAPERVPYFRSLYRRRGQWIPLPLLMAGAGDMNTNRAMDTLRRIADWLPKGFTMEMKREPVFPADPSTLVNPRGTDPDLIHTYYRLTTSETLPPPRFTGEAALEGTEDREVPLEEADRLH